MNLPIRVREEGSRLFQCLQQHLVLFEHLTVCIIRRYNLVIERTNSRLVSLVAIAVSSGVVASFLDIKDSQHFSISSESTGEVSVDHSMVSFLFLRL